MRLPDLTNTHQAGAWYLQSSPESDEDSATSIYISWMMEKNFDWAYQVRQCIKPLVSRRWIKNIHLPSFPDSNSHQDIRLAFKAEFCCLFEKAPLTSVPLLCLCSSGIWVTLLYPRRFLGHHVGCWRDGSTLKSHDSRCWGLLNIFNLDIEDCCGGLKLNRLSFPQGMLYFGELMGRLERAVVREGISNVVLTNKYRGPSIIMGT